jgi:hypothetical protein
MLHGQNFRLNLDGKWEKRGFYTPRITDAPDPLLAENTALEEFRQSTKFLSLMAETLNTDDDPPTLRGEDVEEVQPGTGVGERPAGLAFYSESSESNTESGQGDAAAK